MEENYLLEKLHDLEKQIFEIKNQLTPQKKSVYKKFLGVLDFFKSYGFAILFIPIFLMVTFYYRLDYFFDDYEDKAKYNGLSDHYLQLGEKLMIERNWIMAEEAFKKSIELKKNNIEANMRLAMVDVFATEKGQKYYDVKMAEIKLNQLEKTDAENTSWFYHLWNGVNQDAYWISYLRGQLYFSQNDNLSAIKYFKQSVQENKIFIPAHLAIGDMYMVDSTSSVPGKLDSALHYYQKAFDMDPTNQGALGDLGYCHTVRCKFDTSEKYMEKAYYVSPNVVTSTTLANAYRYNKKFKDAQRYDEWALDILKKEGDSSFLVRDLWYYSFMPESASDHKSVYSSAFFANKKEKELLVTYFYSFDLALNGNFEEANKIFDENLQKGNNTYNDYFRNSINSILYLVQPSAEISAWFNEKKKLLEER